jgi:hypothetical protein
MASFSSVADSQRVPMVRATCVSMVSGDLRNLAPRWVVARRRSRGWVAVPTAPPQQRSARDLPASTKLAVTRGYGRARKRKGAPRDEAKERNERPLPVSARGDDGDRDGAGPGPRVVLEGHAQWLGVEGSDDPPHPSRIRTGLETLKLSSMRPVVA